MGDDERFTGDLVSLGRETVETSGGRKKCGTVVLGSWKWTRGYHSPGVLRAMKVCIPSYRVLGPGPNFTNVNSSVGTAKKNTFLVASLSFTLLLPPCHSVWWPTFLGPSSSAILLSCPFEFQRLRGISIVGHGNTARTNRIFIFSFSIIEETIVVVPVMCIFTHYYLLIRVVLLVNPNRVKILYVHVYLH